MSEHGGEPGGAAREDLIGQYLRELRPKLRVKDAGPILAEAEDHLRETAEAGLAIGMTEAEAQEAAISAFGSVRAVARAHRAKRLELAADLVLAGWKLAWTGMFAIAGSGVIALAMNHLFGRSFVGQAPGGASYPAAACHYWLSIWPGARTCAQAATLENSSDAVSLRLIGGGVAGLLLLAGYLAARHVRRRGLRGLGLRGTSPYGSGLRGARGGSGLSVSALPPALFPLAAVAVFGVAALGLAVIAVIAVTGTPVGVPSGPGAYASGALAALAVAAGHVPAAWRARRVPR